MNSVSGPESKPASRARPRPALFLALGRKEPPGTIEIGGDRYQQSRFFKHDSWAATALYQYGDKQVVIKFNRQQSIMGLPMHWLGRGLARREHAMLERLKDVANVPAACGPISVDGRPVLTASGHDYVAGQSLLATDTVDELFFERLASLLEELHRRDIAYVDLHKRDNVLVDECGLPHLIDFQISLHLPRIWPLTWILGVFQRCDQYHLEKHKRYMRPDLYPDKLKRPAWIKAHRVIAVPFRQVRRWLLVKLGIRQASGMAASEHAPQEEFRSAA